ncbi:MAG TPA: hypothetical protein VGV63_04850 [Acidimicrobiales bacterium]|nr:hypothetical protein [Acidimicrobiales bacterium]
MTAPADLPRLLAIMGSGETSPTMVTPHRRLIERLGAPPVPAVLLDTPFGFQANASLLADRAVEYFRESVGLDIEVAGWRTAAGGGDLAAERSLARLRTARYVFAGPGSPSYALRQWAGSPVPEALADKLDRGGCITFASAAALTLGMATVPVYEIYKVGEDPHWLDGLDLLSRAGLSAAVIPHYDNAEGGNHDTRFCYLGEPRLAAMEEQLPDDAFVLGVDEHTGLVLDLGAGTATVVGRGKVTVRRRGRSVEFPSGTTMPVADLRAAAEGSRGAPAVGDGHAQPPAAEPGGEHDQAGPTSLSAAVSELQERFDRAVAEGDVDAAVAAVLDLDAAVVDWSRDTLQSDQADRARSVLRSMVVRLGELAEAGVGDPEEPVRPFVDVLVELREEARASRDWSTADSLRDRLMAAGVEIRDTPEGTAWRLLS